LVYAPRMRLSGEGWRVTHDASGHLILYVLENALLAEAEPWVRESGFEVVSTVPTIYVDAELGPGIGYPLRPIDG
jgi:hypothetical protein